MGFIIADGRYLREVVGWSRRLADPTGRSREGREWDGERSYTGVTGRVGAPFLLLAICLLCKAKPDVG